MNWKVNQKVASGICASLAGVILVFTCHSAMAQWAWKDDQGHTVFSDQPPPSGIPKGRILKSPGASFTPTPAGDANPLPAATDGDAKPKSLAEQNLEFNKRIKDNQEAAKKAADAQAAAQAKQQNCANTKTALAHASRPPTLRAIGSTSMTAKDRQRPRARKPR
jgi:hypothetical protein